MKVTIVQTQADVVQIINFQIEAETQAQFRTAIHTWLTAHYPAMTITEIFSRITNLSQSVVTLDMT
jgi:tRNA threonylcarbamoyladenosine modification (KEOPS) complex  Pcc1 subunit